MHATVKFVFFFILTGAYGCSPEPSAPVMMHTPTGQIPLVKGENPVKNIKGSLLEAQIGEFLELKGSKTPTEISAGESAEVVLIWQITNHKKLKGKKVFVHGMAPGAEQNQVSADHALPAAKKSHPKIQNGDYIEDRFTIKVPAFFVGDSLQLYTGIYTGKKRFPVSPKSAHDGKNRIPFATLKVGGAKTSLPTAQIPKANGAVTIDGKLDEPAWENAISLTPFILYHGKSAAKQQTHVKATWTSDFLYLAFESLDKDIHTPYTKRDDPIYESEAVEIFIDADGDQDDYVELQAAPNEVQFDASFKGGRRKNFNTGYNSSYLVKNTVEGTLNKAGDQDVKWISEWQIPVKDLVDADKQIKAGAKWRVNLFRLDRIRRNGKVVRSEASAWSSPLSGDFHNIARMGTFEFVE
tara:strand:+ start:781 stop:2010 length:1230 start_codon:yes stop_codon:yes gene_type:complete